ncbi:MAG TPA: chromosome segregation protein SMC [Burkholderiales bacterium]|nr:chromosome segregation protein SMC [Burkholderiales bacterium]
MRLTQVKLSGFKSFVDPTSIHVPGQLVGIVGPNGCGKSNVIDAVRWVLGESRASALRGDSMQDVIFNGAGSRKPLARASVELIFDNSLGRASGQWSQYAELSVRRVLQRDGESSYYINGTHVRRRDITDVFLGTGLGPRAYAIIEQGMISRVIEAKPDELRVFLEEAAGVSRYKERRKETEHRLSDARENLARVNDIRTELGAQIEKLEGQAKIASRYKELQQDLQHKQHLLWYLRRRDASTDRDKHARDIAGVANEVEAGTAQLREVESRVETARQAHYGTGDALNTAQAAVYAANAEVARHESELRHVEESRGRLESQHTERRAQLGAWRDQRAQLTQALHMWAARAGGAKQRVADAQASLAAESARLPEAEQAYRAALEQLNESRSRQQQAESRLLLDQQSIAHLEGSLQSLAQRRERLEAELQSLAEPDAAGMQAANERVLELDRRIADEERALDALLAECERLGAASAAAAEAQAEASREQTAADAQLATLKQVQAAAEEEAPLHEWLARHQLASLPRFWQKIRIEHGWETAVESVLRERLHALELGNSGALGRDRPPVKASLFEPGSAGALPQAPGLVPLQSKVHAADARLGGALGDWFANVYAAEGVPGAAQRGALAPGAVLVNRDGDQFTRHTVSFHAPDPADAGILARQAEIEELEERCKSLAAKASAAVAGAAAAEARLAQRTSALEQAREALAARQQDKHAAQIEALKLGQALERYRERTAQIREEAGVIGQEAARDTARVVETRQALERVAAELRDGKQRLETVRAAYVGAETALAEQRVHTQKAEREAQDAVFGEREVSAKIAEIDNSVRMIDQQIARADEEVARLTSELAVDPVPEVRRALETAAEARMDCEKTLAGARDAVEAAAGELRALEEEKLRIEGSLAPLRERIGELRLKEQAAQMNYDQYDTQLREAGGDEERLAASAEGAPRPSSLQGEITRLTQSMNELGAVNLAALDELASGRERKGFLDAQSADLEEAVRTMEDAIRKIDRETRELLRETFDSVNRHFGSLFPVLFGGGEARLVMTGEEILDAGVQVMAHPPGKRNSSIHLLSGGEKALTAISLVFAMFQLNPAPFCLLDEVDAPLDDSNTERFCDLVRRMSQKTQFLFISHNKITMEMAAQLIGVTMQEQGVSRVVAVDIEEALKLREEVAA